MAEQEDKSRDPLWMFRHDATAGAPKEVEFDPADAIYHLHRNTHNPFLRRALAPAPRKLERSEADLRKLFRFFAKQQRYQVRPVNIGEPFERRSLDHPPPPPQARPRYQTPQGLRGDLRRLPWMIDVFFRAVLSRLRHDPGEFPEVVEELAGQFLADGIRIKLYRAYQTLRDWDDLMDTLEEISRYPSPETFDLFCSALFVYYDLVYPPDEA